MTLQLQTLVVDDEPLAQDLVAGYVRRVPFLSLAGCCSTAAEALDVVRNVDIDVVFLDIQMPGLSGLSFAEALDADKKPKLVFTTAYSEYAIDGFRLEAVDYLLKPFDFEEFMRAAHKVKSQIEQERAASAAERDTFFFVRSDYKLVKVEYEHLSYVEGLKDYVKMYMDDRGKPILTLSTMKQMEARLEGFSFVRVHRSYIVSIKKITGTERGAVFVGGVRIPLGDGYKAKVQAILGRLTL